MTRVLSGVQVARRITDNAAELARSLGGAGVRPQLALVIANDDHPTRLWASSLRRAAALTGVGCRVVNLGSGTTGEQIRGTLLALSNDAAVHGIVLKTPLPKTVALESVADGIHPDKDIDGVNPISRGNLSPEVPGFPTAVARAVVSLLNHHMIAVHDRRVAVVGRSTAVGAPVAAALLQNNATVTVCHRRTPDLAAVTRTADIVVVAAGHPGLITAEHIGQDSIVIDIGMNLRSGAFVGDVDARSVTGRAAALTPVPGGIGPVTTAVLLAHTVRAARAASHASR